MHTTRWAQGISRRGYKVSVISLGGDKIDGVDTIILPVGKSRTLSYFKQLGKVKKLIKKLEPDLLHAHYATSFGLWGKYSKFHPYLISVWGSDVVSFPRNFGKRMFLKNVLASADFINATSNYLKNKTTQLFPRIEPKIMVIPFGVEVPAGLAVGRDDKFVRLVYIKKHEIIYGPDILLHAMRKVVDIKPNVHLTLAGSGSMTKKLKNLIKQLRLENNVTMCGFINNKEMFSFLSRHDIMVMPSFQEAFGVAVLEASAVGLPVIAGNVGGVPEVLDDNKTGMLIEPGDPEALAMAIMKLADNAELRKSMGDAGRKLVGEKYLWESSLDKIAALYNKMISGDYKRNLL